MACQSLSGNDDNGDKKPPPRKAEKKTGYECEFVEPPQEQFQSECPICLQILREPHLTVCCGHSFCAACIGRIEEDDKPCPLCQTPSFTHVSNLGLKRGLNDFHVYCPHRHRGCEWVDELRKLDEHLNSDPQLQRQLEGCPFAVIECLHCKEGVRRDEIVFHQLERCPQRPYACEYCAEYKSTFEDVVHSHWPECKFFSLPCPNNCTPSGSRIQRQHLDQHVKEECPMTVVQCELHHAGCEVTLPRKDMANHMKEDSIAHISLLAAENQSLSKRLVEREEQMFILVQKNFDLEETTSKQSQDLKEAQQHAIDRLQIQQELAQKIASQSQELTQTKNELMQKIISQQQAIDQLQIQQQHDLLELRTDVQMRRNIVPVIIKMTSFAEHQMTNTTWYSHPFYTCREGYKMCLRVNANGLDRCKGTHVSMFTYLMRGEFDAHLKWPFRGSVTIQLVNQLEDRDHHTYTNRYNHTASDASSARVPVKDKSHGRGKHEFIPYSELGLSVANNRQYLKDDCLVFRIVSVN